MPLQAHQIAIVTIANSNGDAKEQPSVRDAKPPDISPADWASRGIIQKWIDGVHGVLLGRNDYIISSKF
jgi:hypothetical protein